MPADIREWTELASQHERLAGPGDSHAHPEPAASIRDQARDGRERVTRPAEPGSHGARRDWTGMALAARTRRWRATVHSA